MREELPLAASEHHVGLFDSSRSLADTVAQFLLDGFGRGERLLVVATPQHCDLLTRKLIQSGLNVRDAIGANRLVMLDASQTLDKFMRQDGPSAVAFEEVIGTVVRRLSGGRRVCIYGEMVDLLASRGEYRFAERLEQMWNDLSRREAFVLFCGYAAGHFGDPKTLCHLGAICANHTHVHRKRDDLLAEYLLNHDDVRRSLPRD
ncbi:MAG TPA: MEDS domain-containing protein [Vicinamibacterales bacterium]|nr:MEDS domain-containing protein [Vicinamibacterales bacterium]